MTKDEARQALLEGKKVALEGNDGNHYKGYIYFCTDTLTIRNCKGEMYSFGHLPERAKFGIYEGPVQFTKRMWMTERAYKVEMCTSWLQDYLFEKPMSSPQSFKLDDDYKLYEITVKEIMEEK